MLDRVLQSCIKYDIVAIELNKRELVLQAERKV